MSKIHGVSASITVAAVLLVAASAGAAITTSYGATNCVQEITLSPTIVYQGSRASTTSASSAFFACPGIQQGGLVVTAKVSGRDLSSSAGVTCHIETKDPFDGTGSFGGSVTSVGLGNFTLNLPPPAAFFAAGSKLVRCTMPPSGGPDGSSIGSYLITEA